MKILFTSLVGLLFALTAFAEPAVKCTVSTGGFTYAVSPSGTTEPITFTKFNSFVEKVIELDKDKKCVFDWKEVREIVDNHTVGGSGNALFYGFLIEKKDLEISLLKDRLTNCSQVKNSINATPAAAEKGI